MNDKLLREKLRVGVLRAERAHQFEVEEITVTSTPPANGYPGYTEPFQHPPKKEESK